MAAFFSPLKVMELEIGSLHKSLQPVGSLVWPSTEPELRSLSTELSPAKHIFKDCACVCVCLGSGGGVEGTCAHAQNKGALQSAQRRCQTCDGAAIFSSQMSLR